MDTSPFHSEWQRRESKNSEEEMRFPLSLYDLVRFERKSVEVVTNFIQGIFNYEKIKISLIKKENRRKSAIGNSSGKLESENGHTKFHYATRLFNEQFYEFSVSNIPATIDSIHIQIFFRVLMQYLSYFYEIIQNDLIIEGKNIKATPSFIAKSDIWLYNIERTIIVEYIYNLFNTYNEDYSDTLKITQRTPRYDHDLLNKIVDFAYELSSKKNENKEIYCGFIFHDKISEVNPNSVKSIKFKNPFDFGDYGHLKNYLDISNGQNIFFNVTKNKVTHLLITREKLNEINLNPIGDKKTFQSRPLILSILGTGKIHFLEGRLDQNKVILQITNSKPVIRDNNFIKQFIYDSLTGFSTASHFQLELFSKWIMSLSQKKHGTSLLFYKLSKASEDKLVKSVKISFESDSFLSPESLTYDLSLLNKIVNPDGAVVFNRNLIPTHIGTILPIEQTATGTIGGARHNSMANFTKEFNCIGIVISEDGPITIFKNGEILIKF